MPRPAAPSDAERSGSSRPMRDRLAGRRGGFRGRARRASRPAWSALRPRVRPAGPAAATRGWASGALVFASIGAHNRPDTSQGVLQAPKHGQRPRRPARPSDFLLASHPQMTEPQAQHDRPTSRDGRSGTTSPILPQPCTSWRPRSAMSPTLRCARCTCCRLPTWSPARTPATARKLLTRFGLSVPMIAAHQHNEREVADKLIARLLRRRARGAGVRRRHAGRVRSGRAHRRRGAARPGCACCRCRARRRRSRRCRPAAWSTTGSTFVGFLPAKAKQRENMLRGLLTRDGDHGVLRGAAPDPRLRRGAGRRVRAGAPGGVRARTDQTV